MQQSQDEHLGRGLDDEATTRQARNNLLECVLNVYLDYITRLVSGVHVVWTEIAVGFSPTAQVFT